MLAFNMYFLRAGSGVGTAQANSGWSGIDPVTIVKRRYNVTGNRWQRTYWITGDSGYTLQTRLKKIDTVLCNDAKITRTSWENGVITFVASAAFTSAKVTVIGRN